ncbi:MAG: hypothetical protein H7837_12975 [Magnetococcus sp. MYC-9]
MEKISTSPSEMTLSSAKALLEKVWLLCEQELAADPDNLNLLHQTSLICVQRGELEQAVERIQRALAKHPGHPVLTANLRAVRVKQQQTRRGTAPLPSDRENPTRGATEQQPPKEPSPEPAHAAPTAAGGGDDPQRREAAIGRLQLILQAYPDRIDLRILLGTLWSETGHVDEAMEQFNKVIQLQPDHVVALCHLGSLQLQKRERIGAVQVLRKAVELDPRCATAHGLLATALHSVVNQGTVYPWGVRYLVSYHKKLADYYGRHLYDPDKALVADTLFVDPARALHCALQGTPFLCYYQGEPVANPPPTLLCIPQGYKGAEEFFLLSRRRFPEDLDFHPGRDEERLAAEHLIRLLDAVQLKRVQLSRQLARVCQATRPEFVPGRPLRVFVPTSRHRAGFFALARDYAQGFAKAGCEVLLFHEEQLPNQEAWEVWGFYKWQQAQVHFNPHVIFDINANFDWHSGGMLLAHPDLFKVLWFQDPMPFIMTGQPIPWRKRDLIYALEEYDKPLYHSGAPKVQRGGFCYNEAIFHDHGLARKNKAVFVGGGYSNMLAAFPGAGKLLGVLEEMFAAGEPMTEVALDRLVRQHPYSKTDILHRLWMYVMRSTSVRWMCELSREMGVDVEIYGHGWEHDATVMPFFKGPLPYGSPELARVYNEARYALVPHPFDLQSIRLVETAACGAIPLVYDCRYLAAQPHWDNYCLWYRTREEMRRGLTQRPEEPPPHISRGRTYTDFAMRVVDDINTFIHC